MLGSEKPQILDPRLDEMAAEEGEPVLCRASAWVNVPSSYAKEGRVAITPRRILAAWSEIMGVVGHRSWARTDAGMFRLQKTVLGASLTFQVPEGEARLERFAEDREAIEVCRALGIPAGRLEAVSTAPHEIPERATSPDGDADMGDAPTDVVVPATPPPEEDRPTRLAQASAPPIPEGSGFGDVRTPPKDSIPADWQGGVPPDTGAPDAEKPLPPLPPPKPRPPTSPVVMAAGMGLVVLMACILWVAGERREESARQDKTRASAPAARHVPRGLQGLAFGMKQPDVRDAKDPMEELKEQPATVLSVPPGGGTPVEAPFSGAVYTMETRIRTEPAICELFFTEAQGLGRQVCGVFDLPSPERHLALEDSLLRDLERAHGLPDDREGSPWNTEIVQFAPTGGIEHYAAWTWTDGSANLRFVSVYRRDGNGMVTSRCVLDNEAAWWRKSLSEMGIQLAEGPSR